MDFSASLLYAVPLPEALDASLPGDMAESPAEVPALEPVLSTPGVLVLVPPAPAPDAPMPVVPPVADELLLVPLSPVTSGPPVGELGPPVLVFVLEVGPAGAVLALSSRPQADTESASATAAAI